YLYLSSKMPGFALKESFLLSNRPQTITSPIRSRNRNYMFVPPQRRIRPRIIIIALAIMIFAMVYLTVQRRNQKPVKESPVQQLQQESGSGSAFAPGDSP